MSEQNSDTQQQSEAPVFRMQKMYTKDLSFENPNAPDVFTSQQNPKVDINMSLKNKALGNDNYEVMITVNAKVSNNEDAKTLFILELEHAGVFLLKNIPAEHMQMVLAVDCPTMLFPFTRQLISQATVDGGFIPFMMEPVNFLALYQNAVKQRDAQQKAAADQPTQ